jgi:DNA-binding HxlR family transcriptional regulator
MEDGILCELQHRPNRLSQPRKAMPEASTKMLTQHLREMEKDGLIVRTDLSKRLRHVEYSLAEPHGRPTLQLINMLAAWGTQYLSGKGPSIREANEQQR